MVRSGSRRRPEFLGLALSFLLFLPAAAQGVPEPLPEGWLDGVRRGIAESEYHFRGVP